MLFICVTNPNGIKVSLRWRMVDADGNRALGVTPEKQEDFDKLLGCEFFWQLVLDEGG